MSQQQLSLFCEICSINPPSMHWAYAGHSLCSTCIQLLFNKDPKTLKSLLKSLRNLDIRLLEMRSISKEDSHE